MKTSRNDPCPCGSGKKFKKCCLNKGDLGQVLTKSDAPASGQYQGLTFEQTRFMVNHPFECEQLVKFNKPPEGVKKSPIMRLLGLLLSACGEGGLKVHKKGQLNKKTVKDIALVYLGLEQYAALNKFGPIKGEGGFNSLQITRVLAEKSGMLYNQDNRLVVSELGQKMRAEGQQPDTFMMLFELAVEYIDWWDLGPWPEFPMIQKGFLFSLFLLARHGDKFRPESLYRDMFLQAIGPGAENDPDYVAKDAQVAFEKAYTWRTMYFMGELFGLVERRPIPGEKRTPPLVANIRICYEVKKTDLLDQWVRFGVPDRMTREEFSQPVIIPDLLDQIRPGPKRKKEKEKASPSKVAKVEEIPPNPIYQLKISLKKARPPIWRRVLVEPGMLLCQVDRLVRAVMGWSGSMDHFFETPKDYPEIRKTGLPENNQTVIKALHRLAKGVALGLPLERKMEEKFCLEDVFTLGARKLLYTLGPDSQWGHDIVLEKVLPRDEQQEYPVCVKGKRACPPEKFVGIESYQRWLFLLRETEFDGMEQAVKDFLDQKFDPEFFELSEAQSRVEKMEWR